MNKKLLISLSVIGAVAAIAVGGTIAYFSDTETSTGNTFTAGELDLKIDSKCTYNDMECVEGYWAGHSGDVNYKCSCNFELKNLDGELLFNLTDIKPGDSGEDTISLHVDSNDACGFVEITKTSDLDNSCTEPEEESLGELCTVAVPEIADGLGELDNNTQFMIWADV